jgi:hypothetical protein
MFASESTEHIPMGASAEGDRLARLLRLGLASSLLVAVLAFVCDGVVPMRARQPRRIAPVALALAVGLGVVLVRRSRWMQDAGQTADGIALGLGLASAILGFGAAFLVGVGVTLNYTEEEGSSHARIYRLTDPRALGEIVKYAGGAALPGLVACGIVRRRRLTGRLSVAASAWRFAVGGLIMASLIAAAAAGAAVYRWSIWGRL